MATTSRDPNSVRAKINQALQAGDPKKAMALSRTLIKLPRATAEDCFATVDVFNRFYDGKTALIAMRQAVRRAPESAMLAIQLAELEFFGGDTQKALDILERAVKLGQTASELEAAGQLYGRIGDAEKALEIYGLAESRDPNAFSVKENMAIALSYLGRSAESEAIYNEVIGAGQGREITYLDRSALRKQTEADNHIEELTAKAASLETGGGDAPYINYALAKEYEDLAQFDKAFSHATRAGEQRRRMLNYSIEPELEEFDEIISAFSAPFFDAHADGFDSDEPIFVLGLPRSGSTLTERFIGAHSKVFGAGELQNFNRVVRHATSEVALADGTYQDVSRVALAPRVGFRALGRSYIESTRPLTGHTPRFTDKMPGNFINIGLIAAALPRAKIIHVHRDPMDACYAMFKQSFAEAYYFTYDQIELAQYYLGYRKLMDHWDKVLPGRIIHLRYEDLVQDTEAVVRDLIARLDLEWEDACLDHTSNSDASMTASATQVRQPIYSSSVRKWRHVGAQLAPLRKTLEEGGLKLD